METCKYNKRVPVFYIPDAQGVPSSMGLAMMYRFPFTYSIGEIVARMQLPPAEKQLDFTQTIFGFVGKPEALRGRIQFSPLKADCSQNSYDDLSSKVMGSPKATYYPTYLEQSSSIANNELYSTYNDPRSENQGLETISISSRQIR